MADSQQRLAHAWRHTSADERLISKSLVDDCVAVKQNAKRLEQIKTNRDMFSKRVGTSQGIFFKTFDNFVVLDKLMDYHVRIFDDAVL